jgi:hypothetical protein
MPLPLYLANVQRTLFRDCWQCAMQHSCLRLLQSQFCSPTQYCMRTPQIQVLQTLSHKSTTLSSRHAAARLDQHHTLRPSQHGMPACRRAWISCERSQAQHCMADPMHQLFTNHSQSSAAPCQYMTQCRQMHTALTLGCSRASKAVLPGRTCQAGLRAGTCLHLCRLGVSTSCTHQSCSRHAPMRTRLLPLLMLKKQRHWQPCRRRSDRPHRPSFPHAKHPAQVVLRPLLPTVLGPGLAALPRVAGVT